MYDFWQAAEQAKPGEPVETLGFDSVPDAGDTVRNGRERPAGPLPAGERAFRLKTEALARRRP